MTKYFVSFVAWLKQLLLHALGHAFGVAIAAAAVILFGAFVIAPDKTRKECPAPLHLIFPELHPAAHSSSGAP